ncbi:hypothetical protein S40285_02356 [Stachybotrys chlorohalonatus IBT 40285]|uniref:Fatty acid hydroxylase domain-containing protein n=1 Tax=Stachybotrys chlorohalonatus (strain IBT 40285) TaxID=1283841 RepID=A0A084QPR3_STAC4|nr:hypothetical protein S40285_02356 [Stachybotrys chlorohalonata IBT 40285]
MDLLLSLPLASYFLAPSITSWSTSLNLLFFYMTWTTLVLSHPPLRVHLAGLLAIRTALCLAPALASLLLDTALPSVAEGIKYGGRSALPPRNPRALSTLVALAMANLALLTAVEGACSWAFVRVVGEPEFKTGTTLPLPWQMLRHVLITLTAREVLHYYINRHILHGQSSIASLHARYAHHRAAAPFSLQLLTDHPLALVLHRFVPLYLPSLILRPHLLTYFLLVAVCTAEETLAMSGYNIVPGIVMGGIVQRTAIHYASRGASNFGAWGILDWLHGTGSGRHVLEDVRDEADKHHLKERSAKKAGKGAGLLQNGMEALTNGSDKANGTPRRSGRKRTTRRLD